MDVKIMNSRGTKTRQGTKKKKKSMNFINLKKEEQDFRAMPLPEEIKETQIQYPPLDRENFSKNRRGMERASTVLNLHQNPQRVMVASDSNASLNLPNLNLDLQRNKKKKFNFKNNSNLNYAESFEEPILENQDNFNENFEIPRFNPQTNSIEGYNNLNFNNDEFEIPKIYTPYQHLGIFIFIKCR